MAFFGYKGDVGECYWTPYNTSSYDFNYDYDDVISPQDSVTYSSLNEFDQPKLIIEHSPYNYFDSSATTQQIPNYLVYNYTQQQVSHFEPPLCVSDSFYSQANSSVLNPPTVEFAEPVFEEYDPTPYGGGYDITQTYGKPLPPSHKICYPRSTPQPNLQPPVPVPHDSSLGPIPSANEHHDNQLVKPHKDKDSESADNQEKQNHSDNEENESGNTQDVEKPLEIKVSDVDEHPSSDYNNGCGYDWNRQLSYTPYGFGLEAMDLCESIFGYWPCIAKINRQRNANCIVCNEETQNEPWKSAADYLFGSQFGYGEQNNGNTGYHFYSNGSYYQHQAQYPNDQG